MNSKLKMILENQRIHWKNVVLELLNGRKETHWCWYFLPNVPGLGKSPESIRFAVTPKEFYLYMQNNEYAGNIFTVIHLIDQAYRRHPKMNLTEILANNPIDVLKWNSCLTLVRSMYIMGLIDVGDAMHSMILGSDHHGVCQHTVDVLKKFESSAIFMEISDAN